MLYTPCTSIRFLDGDQQLHLYTQIFIRRFTKLVAKMEEFNSPLLIGEFNVVLKGAGGGEMMRRYYDL